MNLGFKKLLIEKIDHFEEAFICSIDNFKKSVTITNSWRQCSVIDAHIFLKIKNTLMKNLFLICMTILSANLITAQNIIDDKFQHLTDLDNATTINITGKLFDLVSHFDDTGDEEADEIIEFASKITGIKLLALEDHSDAANEYTRGMSYIGNDFDELIQIRSKDGNLSIFVDEEDGVIYELVGLGTDNSEFLVFTLTGEMDLNKVGEIVSDINLDGRDRLETLEDLEIDDLKIYPNPSSRNGEVTLEIPKQFKGGTATVVDESGRVIKTYKLNSSKQTIDTSNFSSGLHFVKISKDGVSMKKKIVLVD